MRRREIIDYSNRKWVPFWMRTKQKQLNRSKAGNGLLFAIMLVCGVFMALPLIMIINNTLKPLDEASWLGV